MSSAVTGLGMSEIGRRLMRDPEDPKSLTSNRVWQIFEDQQRRIWVATDRGLNLWLPEIGGFHHYRHEPGSPESLSDDIVYDVMQDSGNVLWVGTFSGISKSNIEINTFAHIRSIEGAISTLSQNRVTAFAENNDY